MGLSSNEVWVPRMRRAQATHRQLLMMGRRTVAWLVLVLLVASCGFDQDETQREPDLDASSTSAVSAPTTSLAAEPSLPDPTNAESSTAGTATALQLEMTENGARENLDGSEGRTYWDPGDREGIPDFFSSGGETVFLSDGHFELAVICEERGFAIAWHENGFELMRSALSPRDGRLPTSMVDFTCNEGNPLGIFELPAQSGDFVNIERLDGGRYELSSNNWRLIIERRSA